MASTILKQTLGHQKKRQATVKRVKPQHVPTTDAVILIHRRFVEGHPELEEYYVEELERILIGNQIYDLRTNAKMTHAALAKKVGTTAATIDRLENADFEGHPLPMLRKIAAVFGMRIELNFVPLTEQKTKTKTPAKSQTKS